MKKIELPSELVEKYINLHGNRPVKLSNGQVNFGCPICREGNSWGRKRRMYYFPKENYLYCFNCNQSYSPLKFIMEVSGKPMIQILDEAKQYSFISTQNKISFFPTTSEKATNENSSQSELPNDAITLNSQLQQLYYANDPIVKKAITFISNRRLDSAINVPKYSLSLTDPIHKNRLIIPFTDLDGSIPFYQTRKILDSDYLPKYLSKRNSDKTVFGLDKIDLDYPYMFITEGPIDSCFLKNGVSLAGLKYTDKQTDQLSNFFTHKRIWVLDNDFKTNPTVLKQYQKLIEDGENIFIWPSNMAEYKDINEYCMKQQTSKFDHELIIENTYRGLRATQILRGFVR